MEKLLYDSVTGQPIGFPATGFFDNGGHGTAVAGVAAAATDNQDRYAGPIVQVYDVSEDSLTLMKLMPTPRRELAGAAVGGRIYAIGGRNPRHAALSALEIYDISADVWSTASEAMPTARTQLAVAAVGGSLYAIGGSPDTSSTLATNEVYDTATGSWTTLAPMPAGRRALAAAALGASVYAIGGNGGAGPVKTVEIYDPATDSWSAGPPLNVPREALAAVAIGGTIYAIGGDDGSGPVDTVELYDGTTTCWITSSDRLPTPRRWLSAATDGTRIFAVGGENAKGEVQPTDEWYLPGGGWSSRAPIAPTSRALGVGWDAASGGYPGWAIIGGGEGGGIAGMARDASIIPYWIGDTDAKGIFESTTLDTVGDVFEAWSAFIPVPPNRLGRASHRIINMSFGCLPEPVDSAPYVGGVRETNNAERVGHICVAAAGNAGMFEPNPVDPSSTSYADYLYVRCHSVFEPAVWPNVIAVAQSAGDCAGGSHAGPEVALAAPSAGSVVAVPLGASTVNQIYAENGHGTSFASPMVAGTAACLVDQNPDWYGETVRRRLRQTAYRTACITERNCSYEAENGAGRLDAYAALGGPPGGPGCVSRWLYLSDSRTILPGIPPPDYRGHYFPTNTGGDGVTFQVTVANPAMDASYDISCAAGSIYVGVTRPDGTLAPPVSDCVNLFTSDPSGTVTTWSIGTYATTVTNYSYREAFHTATVFVVDPADSAVRYAIPAPAIVVAGDVPVTITATLMTKNPNACDPITVRVQVFDATGHWITEAPVEAMIEDAPVPQTLQPKALFADTQYHTTRSETGGAAAPWCDFVINPSAKAGSYTVGFSTRNGLVYTTLVFTASPCPAALVVLKPQYDFVYPGAHEEIRAHLEDMWGNDIANPDPVRFCMWQTSHNGGILASTGMIGSDGVLRQGYQAGPAGTCDTMQAALFLDACGGTATVWAEAMVCPAAPDRISYRVAPDRVPAGGPVQLLIEALGGPGWPVGGVPVTATVGPIPPGATAFVSDYYAAWMSKASVTVLSDSPEETVVVLHTGDRTGTYYVTVSIPGASKTIGVVATRDWPQWRRDQMQNPSALGEILKPPLKPLWSVNPLGRPPYSMGEPPTTPLMDGGVIFAPQREWIAALDPVSGTVMHWSYLPDIGYMLCYGPAVEPLFDSQRVWFATTNTWATPKSPVLDEMDYLPGPGFILPGSMTHIDGGNPWTSFQTIVDGTIVIEANPHSGLLAAYDALSLTPIWGFFRQTSTSEWTLPAIACGRVYFAYPQLNERKISAFDMRSGDIKWTATLSSGPIVAPPVVVRDVETGRVRVIVYQQTQNNIEAKLQCFDGLTGETLWTTAMTGLLSIAAWNNMVWHLNLTVAAQDRIYFMYNHHVLPWLPDTGEDPDIHQWLLAARLSDGELDTSFSVTLSGQAQALAAANGHLYVVDKGETPEYHLRIFRAGDGELMQDHPFGWGTGAPLGIAVTNEMVLAQCGDGTVHAWGAGVNCPRNVRGGPEGASIRLKWDPPVEGTYPVTSYRILRATTAGGAQTDLSTISWTATTTATTYLDSQTDCRSSYYYQVLALDTEGHESERCQEVPLRGAGAQLTAVSLSNISKNEFECVGNVRQLRLTVRNDGSSTAWSMRAGIAILQGSATIMGSVSFTPSKLSPGVTGYATWGVKATGGGDLELGASAIGVDACSSLLISSATAYFGPVAIQSASVIVASTAPPLVHPGVTFTVTITAFNAGTETVELTQALFMSWTVGGLGYVPNGNVNLDPGKTASFLYQLQALKPGRITLGTGVRARFCQSGTIFYASDITLIVGRAALVVASANAPKGVCPGDVFHVDFTVTNAGDGFARLVRVTQPLVTGSGAVAGGGIPPPGVLRLAPGSATAFSFTYTAVGSGTSYFRSSAYGYDESSGVFMSSPSVTSNPVRISDSTLSVSVFSVGQAAVGATIYASVSVTNTSGVPAYWVKPALSVAGPPAAVLSTPSPASVTMLGDGASRSFTWKYRVDSWGVLALAASATATICSTPVGFAATGAVFAGRAILAGTSLTVDPTPPCPNSDFQIVLGITNPGDGGAVNITPGTPVVWVQSGDAGATLVTSPPLLPALAPGASASFTWAYHTGTGTGTVKFIAGATGADALTGRVVSFDPVVSDPVDISRGLVATASVPGAVTRGVPFPLVLTCINLTSSTATVYPNPMSISRGASLLASQTGPSPGGVFTVTPGGTQSFTWTYVTNGMGVITFSPSVNVDACGSSGGAGPGEIDVTSFNGGGDWLTWGHDAQHTFRQAETTPLDPPLEELWSVPGGTSPIVVGDLSYWIEPDPGYVNWLVARRLLNGEVVWRVKGAFTPPAMASDGTNVYVINIGPVLHGPVLHIAAYDARTGAKGPAIYPTYGAMNLTVDNGRLYVISATGLSIYAGGAVFSRAATDFAGVTKLLTAPPLVVNGDIVVIGINASGQNPRLIRAGPSGQYSMPLDLLPSDGPNAGYLSFDGTWIIVTGQDRGNGVVEEINPVNGVMARKFTWTYGNEIYGPVLDLNGDILTRRLLPYSTVQGVGYGPSSALRLTPMGSGFTYLTTNEPLWWSGDGLLGGRSAAANGYVYHEGGNFALKTSWSTAPRTLLHAVDANNGIVWAATSRWPAVLPDMKAPAVARGLLFMDGGSVWGPRTIDPPTDLWTQSVPGGVSLTWQPPATGAADVDHYEVYRAEGAKGQIWAEAFLNPAVSPAPVLVATPVDPLFTDTATGLVPGRIYWYAVRAVTGSGRPATSWFTQERVGVAGGSVAEITSPTGCAVAWGGWMIVRGRAYFRGTPDLFARYEVAVDGVVRYTSTQPKGSFGTTAELASVSVPASGCHAIGLRVYATDGSSMSTNVSVGGNPGVSCPGCGQAPQVTVFSEHRHPEGIATDAADFVYVVDSLRQRVERFDAEGRLLWEVGNPDASGRDSTGLKAPVSAAVGTDGSIFVADKLRNQVVGYDEDGGFRYSFGGAGDAPGRFREPSGIAIDPAGYLWVADRLTGRLQQFTADGTFVRSAESAGAAKLKEPMHLWVEPSGTVWVADSGHHRVCAFDREGRLVRTVGETGGLAGPSGVAVEEDGRRVFVSDTRHDRIAVFDADSGTLLSAFGVPGSAVGEMRQPGGWPWTPRAPSSTWPTL